MIHVVCKVMLLYVITTQQVLPLLTSCIFLLLHPSEEVSKPQAAEKAGEAEKTEAAEAKTETAQSS